MGILLVSLMQYHHLINSDMGIRTPGLVEAETWMSPEEAENMVSDLRRQPMVENATRSMHGVLGEYWTRGLIDNSGKRIETLMYNPCDKNYAETMGITIIEGKDMQNEGDVLVNEEVVRLMKWTDGAVGKRLNDFDKAGTIVSVFRNVRNTSFLYKQFPVALVYSHNTSHTFDVRLKQPYDESLKKLNEYMEQVHSTKALEFIPIDTMLKEIYRNVYRFRNSVWITSTFILLIVVMGLIGYVNDETQRRSKEIAIRKVNGAEANFAQAAQRADVHGNSRGGSIIIMLLIAAALRAAGALHRGRSCCIHRIARCSLLGLRGTAALRLAVLGLWFFRRCLRGAGRGGRRTGFAVLVIIICARGTAGVIAAALLAGAFFVCVECHTQRKSATKARCRFP